jgi:hypothetical protein
VDVHQDRGRAFGVQQLHAAIKHFFRSRPARWRPATVAAVVRGIAQQAAQLGCRSGDTDDFSAGDVFAAIAGPAKDVDAMGPLLVPHFARPAHENRYQPDNFLCHGIQNLVKHPPDN